VISSVEDSNVIADGGDGRQLTTAGAAKVNLRLGTGGGVRVLSKIDLRREEARFLKHRRSI
jgi:hypothetical protein